MDKTRKTSKRRPRRSFTPEFKAEAVRLCRIGDRSVAQVAKDLDLIETVLRECAPRANARPLLAYTCGPRELDPAGRRLERLAGAGSLAGTCGYERVPSWHRKVD